VICVFLQNLPEYQSIDFIFQFVELYCMNKLICCFVFQSTELCGLATIDIIDWSIEFK